MLRLYAPVGVALVAIVSFTVWAGMYSDRFVASSVTAAELGKRFANVPMNIGSWEGTDMTPEKETIEQAGAVSYVSRRYVNSETHQSVDLWLIVGHSRDICRHTPDICYPSHGFSQIGARVRWTFDTENDPDHAPAFFTAKFRNESEAGNRDTRVFWAWNARNEGEIHWEAPEQKTWFDWLPVKSIGPKTYFGNNTALYKLYFTAPMGDANEDVADSVAIEFAELMLPRIDRALFPELFAGEKPLPASAPSPGESLEAAPETEAAPAEPTAKAEEEAVPAAAG